MGENEKEFMLIAGGLATESLMKWLKEIGYFEAPAGKSHHGAFKGGLYEHSKVVAEELCNLTLKLGLEWERPQSPVLIGLLHDICKTKEYVFLEDETIE